MRVIIGISCGIAIGVIWVLLGSRISLVVDRCFTGQPSPEAADPTLINQDSFIIGSRKWPLPRPGEFGLKIFLDSQKRMALGADGRSFTLGPVRTMWGGPEPQYLFVPEAGDAVSFTREAGRLAWWTPFAFSIMGGEVPAWHRYVYDRLRWIKASGARLEITWRDVQDGYRTGWADSYTNRLTNVSIRLSPIEAAAAAYLAKTKGWGGGEYRLESEASTADDAVVAAVWLKDEAARAPGAGKSVVLRINKRSRKVVGETAFQ